MLKTEKSIQHKNFHNIKTSSKHVVCSSENLLSFWAKSLAGEITFESYKNWKSSTISSKQTDSCFGNLQTFIERKYRKLFADSLKTFKIKKIQRNNQPEIAPLDTYNEVFTSMLNFFLGMPSGHVVCMFNNLLKFFCPELQKEIPSKSQNFENWKIHSTQKKLLSKLPLNTSFVVLRTCWLSGPNVCHRSGQALTIQKTGSFKKNKTVPPDT